MKIISLLLIIILSACAPSAESIQTAVAQTQASYTDTPAPTDTPVPTPTLTATATPDLAFAYFKEYLPYMQEWGEQFQIVNDLTQRLGAEGRTLLDDEEFRDQLVDAMAAWESAAKKASEIPAPNEDMQRFQSMAEELHKETETYANFYLIAMTGDITASQLAVSALDRAGVIFTEIADEITKGNYIP